MTLNIAKPTRQQRTGSPAEVFLPDDNNFPYGWRLAAETLPDGRIAYRRLPLSPADFLDPQEGDQLIQSNIHVQQSVAIYNMLDNHYSDEPGVGVFLDMKMRWGIPGLKEPAPDVAVVPNLNHKEASRRSFDVVKEGTRPCLIVEVISPHYPGDDSDKVEIYERAGVTEYIIIDPHAEAEARESELWGYRLVGNKYQPMQADEQGRLLSQTTGLWFELDERRRWVVLTDATTGEPLLTARGERAARLEAEARAAELEARLRELENKQSEP